MLGVGREGERRQYVSTLLIELSKYMYNCGSLGALILCWESPQHSYSLQLKRSRVSGCTGWATEEKAEEVEESGLEEEVNRLKWFASKLRASLCNI